MFRWLRWVQLVIVLTAAVGGMGGWLSMPGVAAVMGAVVVGSILASILWGRWLQRLLQTDVAGFLNEVEGLLAQLRPTSRQFSTWQVMRAGGLAMLWRYEEAFEALQKVRPDDVREPHRSTYEVLRLRCLLQLGRLEEAQPLAADLRGRDLIDERNRLALQVSLGILDLLLGRLEESRERLTALLDAPGHPDGKAQRLFHLACAERRLGHGEVARSYLEEARRLASPTSGLHEAIGNLLQLV